MLELYSKKRNLFLIILITINGTNYCENFNGGRFKTHEVLIGSDTEPEG